jgi:hypothetical protein
MRFFLGIACLVMGQCLVNQAGAQDYNQLSKQYATAAGNTWEQIVKPRFMAVMTSDERRLVNSIDFRFRPGLGTYDVFADVAGGSVVVSGAFIAFQDAALSAFLLSYHFGVQDQFAAYLDYAYDKAVENVAHWKNRQPLLLIPGFASYANLDQRTVAQFGASAAYQGPLAALRVESLAFVLGHEIGHHYDNDRGPADDEEQIKRESKADQYSMKLNLRAGFSPWSAIPVMMFFHEAGGDNRHPPPMCRLVAFYTLGLPALLSDPQFQAFNREHPEEAAKVDTARSIIEQHRADIDSECGDWVLAPN